MPQLVQIEVIFTNIFHGSDNVSTIPYSGNVAGYRFNRFPFHPKDMSLGKLNYLSPLSQKEHSGTLINSNYSQITSSKWSTPVY